jgi:hypothetical protein
MLRISPYHYSDHGRADVIKKLKSMGWKDYGGKHLEHKYTAWIGCNLLPNKFGIDKRRTYLSAAIREGNMTKEYAKEILSKPMEFDLNLLGERKAHILHLADSSPLNMSRAGYSVTNYKKWKPILWVLMKLKIFPLSAYKKYCQ